MFCFGILSWKENRASIQVNMLYLNPNKFSDSTAELVNHLKHQLMIVIVNGIKELAQFFLRQIPYNFSETFVSFCLVFSFSGSSFFSVTVYLG